MTTPWFNQSRSGAAGAAVVDTAGSDREQIATLGLQCVTDVAERGAVGPDALPVSAGAGDQCPVDLGTGEDPADARHDPPVPTDGFAQIQRWGDRGLGR
jgi:hypothetical protein